MQMLYNSDNYAVVLFDLAAPRPAGDAVADSAARGGYEIVD